MRIRYWSSDVCSSDLDELFKKLFEQLRARGASTTDYDNIRSTFRQLCVRYALTGIPQFVESHRADSLDYIDSGVCRLVREQGTSRAVIDEQMMVIAACNHFELQSYQWELCTAVSDEATSLGYQFERSLMLLRSAERRVGKECVSTGRS